MAPWTESQPWPASATTCRSTVDRSRRHTEVRDADRPGEADAAVLRAVDRQQVGQFHGARAVRLEAAADLHGSDERGMRPAQDAVGEHAAARVADERTSVQVD